MKIKKTNKLNNSSCVVYFLNNQEELAQYEPIREEYDFLVSQISNGEAIGYIIKPNRTTVVSIPKKYAGSETEAARRSAANVYDLLKKQRVSDFQIVAENTHENILAFLEGLYFANYSFNKYFTDKKDNFSIKNITLYSLDVNKEDLEELSNVMTACDMARDLINEPANELTSTELSARVRVAGKSKGLKIKVLSKEKLVKMGMGGILSVNLGSHLPPNLTILEWKPNNATNKEPIALVGKGVVYDTGGLSIKPTPNSMDKMKSDMGGAAVVASTMMAIAENKLPIYVVALLPITDNRVSAKSYSPGDVIKMYSGTTVEVLNTDAEGRLILADALAYAKEYKPTATISVATLTGAAARAIGRQAAVVMGNNCELVDGLKKSGNTTFERLAEFPFWDDYSEMIKSDIADLKNIGGESAGAITAGKFLEHFAPDNYAHIDIAGVTLLDSPVSYRGKGASGFGVRLLYDYLKNQCKENVEIVSQEDAE